MLLDQDQTRAALIADVMAWEVALEEPTLRKLRASTRGMAYSFALTMTLLGGGALLKLAPQLWYPIMAATSYPLVVSVSGIIQARARESAADRVIQTLTRARMTSPTKTTPPMVASVTPLPVPLAIAPPAPHVPIHNPAKDLGLHPQSALIAGVPGAGKTLFVLEALHHLTIHHPDVTVIMLDPKCSDVERLEPHGVQVVGIPISKLSNGDAAYAIREMIHDFRAIQGPKLLVLDELASVVRVLKTAKVHPEFIDFLTFITSMGDSEQAWVWGLTQDASCESLGMSSAMRANLRAVGLVSPKNRNSLQAFLNGGWLPPHPQGSQGLYALMESSPTGRAIFDGKQGQWAPLPKLENRTGNDRDKRVIGAHPNPKPTPPRLSPPERELLDWLHTKQGTPLKVRDIMRTGPTSVRGWKSAQIQEVLERLSKAPEHRLEWDGEVVTSTPLKALV